MSSKKQQRPGNARTIDSRMKLHLRLVTVGKTTYHVITLRPGTQVAFSTNYFHETWHILSNMAGAKVLARLLWGLSFQKVSNTVVVIHGEHLKPTPFDADPSKPILLVPAHLSHLDAKTLPNLRYRLDHLEAPTQTIRWQTFGLDNAIAKTDKSYELDEYEKLYWTKNRHLWNQEQMCQCGGFVCYVAPPPILRINAHSIYRIDATRSPHQMDYRVLADCHGSYGYDGEVQIFSNYQRMLSTAAVARRKVLAQLDEPVDANTLRDLIHKQHF